MNEPNQKPRYFRLLEKGEIIKEGDYFSSTRTGELCNDVSVGTAVGVLSHVYFRPVQVDEWISYSERRPTKEDFKPTGSINYYFSDGVITMFYHDTPPASDVTHWRRITPPEQPKPKSIAFKLLGEKNGFQMVEAFADGSVKAYCGQKYSAESIDNFIRVREKVMKQ